MATTDEIIEDIRESIKKFLDPVLGAPPLVRPVAMNIGAELDRRAKDGEIRSYTGLNVWRDERGNVIVDVAIQPSFALNYIDLRFSIYDTNEPNSTQASPTAIQCEAVVLSSKKEQLVNELEDLIFD